MSLSRTTTPSTGRHRAPVAPSATRRRLGRAAVATLAAGAPLAGLGLAAPAAHADTDWDELAQCESGGDWSINTGNGFSGGLQFTPSTWKAFGGSGKAENASREEQIAVAEKVKAAQGMTAWPTCSKKTGNTSSAPNGDAPSTRSASSDDDDASEKSEKKTEKKTEKKADSTSAKAEKAEKKTEKKADRDGERETQVAAARTEPSDSTAAPAGGDYTVRAGDTLSSIAASRGTTWKALQSANPDVISDPNLIMPGWTLVTG